MLNRSMFFKKNIINLSQLIAFINSNAAHLPQRLLGMASMLMAALPAATASDTYENYFQDSNQVSRYKSVIYDITTTPEYVKNFLQSCQALLSNASFAGEFNWVNASSDTIELPSSQDQFLIEYNIYFNLYRMVNDTVLKDFENCLTTNFHDLHQGNISLNEMLIGTGLLTGIILLLFLMAILGISYFCPSEHNFQRRLYLLPDIYRQNMPDYARCLIATDSVMNHPITLPNGITYDRDRLLEQFERERSNYILCVVSRRPLYKADVMKVKKMFSSIHVLKIIFHNVKKRLQQQIVIWIVVLIGY